MEYLSKKTTPSKAKTDALIIPFYKGQTFKSAGAQLDADSTSALSAALKLESCEGNAGDTLLLRAVDGIAAKRVLLVGLGTADETKPADMIKGFKAALASLKSSAAQDASVVTADIAVGDFDANWIARQLVTLVAESQYRFDAYKSKQSDKKKGLNKLTLIAADTAAQKQLASGAQTGQALADGVAYCKDLGNTPPNVCNPTYLAQEAKKLAKKYKSLTTTVLDEKELKAMGMGAFVAVSQGSETPGKLIIMEYKGGDKNAAPHVLVGKGITFDTGGISLKPGAGMDEMKWDMGGAASVFGTMQTLLELQPAINVIGVVAAAENMPSGKASRPGDIVTTLSGQTVEILNTDAEGRLVLCDALTYVERFKPASVIDIATLTGAVIVALGPFASGLMSNDEGIVERLQAASNYSQDKVWRLPLWDEYQALLDSPFADIGNIGNAGPKAGSITAGCFLSRFTKAYPWAHLDVAGSAFNGGAKKGATGRPVPLLTEYLLSHLSE